MKRSQVVNSIYNLGAIYIINSTSASWLNVATTLTIPLSNFMFASPFFMGPLAATLNASDYLSLAIVCLAVILYNHFDKEPEGEDGDDRGRYSNIEDVVDDNERSRLIS